MFSWIYCFITMNDSRALYVQDTLLGRKVFGSFANTTQVVKTQSIGNTHTHTDTHTHTHARTHARTHTHFCLSTSRKNIKISERSKNKTKSSNNKIAPTLLNVQCRNHKAGLNLVETLPGSLGNFSNEKARHRMWRRPPGCNAIQYDNTLLVLKKGNSM